VGRLGSDDWKDIQSAIIEAFYSLSEFDCPKTEEEFLIWAYNAGQSAIQKKRKHALKIESLTQIGHDMLKRSADSGMTTEEEAGEIAMFRDSLRGRVKPEQESYVHCMDILRSFGRLPDDLQRSARILLDYGDITEFAKERQVSLFDALKEQAYLRTVLRRLMEDDADERRDVSEPLVVEAARPISRASFKRRRA